MESEILWALLRANVAASLAILFILPTRLYVRKMFGGRAAYALWLLAPAAAAASLLPARRVFVAVDSQPVPPLSVSDANSAADSAAASGAEGVAPSLPALESADGFLFATQLPALLLGVWIAGTAVMAAIIAHRQRRFIKSLGRLEVDRVAELCILRSQQPGVGPALTGFLRPSIILPFDFENRFNEEERALIIAHERMHVAAGDAAVNFLIAAALSLCWFNPLVHVAARFIRGDQEIACDTDVMAHFPNARRTYAEALFKTQLSTDAAPVGCAWPAPSVHPLKERIEIVGGLNIERARRRVGLVIASATAVIGGAIAWAAQPPVRIVAPSLQSLAATTSDLPASRQAINADAPGVDLENIAARLTVIAEDRSDYAVEITPAPGLPAPRTRSEGERLIVDGGLDLRENPCRVRFDETTPAQIPGIGSVAAQDMPSVVVRAPRAADITVDGAVLSNIGATRGGRFENHGCGDMRIAAATKGLDVSLYGYGDVIVADLSAPLRAFLGGTGNIRLGQTGDAILHLGGVGDITGGDVNGALKARLGGMGNIRMETVRSDAGLRLGGAGDIVLEAVYGQLSIHGRGAGDVNIETIENAQTNIEISGSVFVDIKQGKIGQLSADLSPSRGIRFGGEVGAVDATFWPGAPDIIVGSAGDVNVRRNGSAAGNVVAGR